MFYCVNIHNSYVNIFVINEIIYLYCKHCWNTNINMKKQYIFICLMSHTSINIKEK